VRYRLMATYGGSPFEAGVGPTDGDIVLFAACPPPEELGFEPATGHWRKQLRFADVQAVWESRPVGTFRGERCMVLDDLGDRLHIGYLGHDGLRAGQLGYWQVDRGVFELVAPRTEVSDIVEERTEYRRPGQASYPQALSPDPGPPEPANPNLSPGYPQPASYPPVPDYRPAPTSSPAYQAVPDGTTGVALPVPAEAPLPLEAEAMRAATASRRPRPAPAARRSGQPRADRRAPATAPAVDQPDPAAPNRRRTARRRLATERLFADLAGLAGIPADSYAVGEEVEGAMCLLETETGFEVFHSADGARHELQVFTSEESACFYLFGVLAAEAVRTGSLTRRTTGPAELGLQPQTA
jgi:hypothetical protein